MVAGTPVIDSPRAAVTTSCPSMVTRTMAALASCFCMMSRAMAMMASARSPAGVAAGVAWRSATRRTRAMWCAGGERAAGEGEAYADGVPTSEGVAKSRSARRTLTASSFCPAIDAV